MEVGNVGRELREISKQKLVNYRALNYDVSKIAEKFNVLPSEILKAERAFGLIKERVTKGQSYTIKLVDDIKE